MSIVISAMQHLLAFLYHVTLPIQNVLFTVRNILLSYLPRRVQRRINILHDIAMAIINITFGRIQPSLRPYLPQSSSHLTGKTAIVTGANSGIGLQIAKDLAQQGADVVLAVRNIEKGKTARLEIIKQFPQAGDRVRVMLLDTSSLKSVRAFVENWATTGQNEGNNSAKLDILVHNAGIAASGDSAISFSADGFPLVYATNLLGSFLLTHLLESYLCEDARVVLTSSTGQYGCRLRNGFRLHKVVDTVEPNFHVLTTETAIRDAMTPDSAYAMSKGMQCAFARALQRKWVREGKKQIVHSFTPGFTATPIFGKYKVKSLLADPIYGLLQVTTVFAMDVREGAATGTWLASAPVGESEALRAGGRYWDRMTCRISSADILEDSTLDQLWMRWSKDAGVEWK